MPVVTTADSVMVSVYRLYCVASWSHPDTCNADPGARDFWGEQKETKVASLIKKSFDAPDETRTPDKSKVEVVDLGGVKAARMTMQPGWKWSECVKPIVGTDSCQSHHVGTVASGQLHVIHDDGSELDCGPGAAYVIQPGHDAWVVGNDPVVAYEFDSDSAATYAKK